MGVDKSMHIYAPVVVIDGEVYRYGQVDDWEEVPPRWMVEHHSNANVFFSFDSEREMLDFIDGLPESAHPPIPRPRDDNWDAYWDKVREWRRQHAAMKRSKRVRDTLPPDERYVANCRRDIIAVLDGSLRVHDDGLDDPRICDQVRLILAYHLRTYREIVGWESLDPDYKPPF